MSDVVVLKINGKPVNEIVSYTLHYDIFEGAATFTAEIDFDFIIALQAAPHKAEWFINGEQVFLGLIDKIDKSYSKSNRTLQISGRDLCSVFIDNHVIYPRIYGRKESSFSTFQSIITDIFTRNHSVDKLNIYIPQTTTWITTNVENFVQYTPAAAQTLAINSSIWEYRCSYGQSLWDSINAVCNMVGCYMYNPPGQDYLLVHAWTTPDKDPVSYDNRGNQTIEPPYVIANLQTNNAANNVMNASFSEDITHFYKYIKVVGQTEGAETIGPMGFQKQSNLGLNPNALKIERTIESFHGPTKFIVKELNDADINIWQNQEQGIINNQILQQNRHMYTIKYTVPDHSPSGTTPYYVNHLAVINDAFIPMENAIFQVYGVEYVGDKNQGRRTNLTLALPAGRNSYTDQVWGNPNTYNKPDWSMIRLPGTTPVSNAVPTPQIVTVRGKSFKINTKSGTLYNRIKNPP